MHARDWKAWIICFGVFILIGGLLNVGSPFLAHSVVWVSVVVGVGYIIAGAFGIWAGVTVKRGPATAVSLLSSD